LGRADGSETTLERASPLPAREDLGKEDLCWLKHPLSLRERVRVRGIYVRKSDRLPSMYEIGRNIWRNASDSSALGPWEALWDITC
jgi:hypothetical protein